MPVLHTQTSSKPRLQNDTLGGAEALKQLYAYHSELDFDQFKVICADMVQKGGGKQGRKDEIIQAIRFSTSKDQALKKAQDFILAGMGLGV